MPSKVTMRTLLETGVHFGHRIQKWNPKMDPFIFTKRNGIHIIDLQQTLANLNKFHDIVRDTVADGGHVLFVGTKRQAQEIVAREARRCGMPYVNYRWLGGTMTNWRTISERIRTLEQLEKRRAQGEFELLTKKEGLLLEREIAKLQLRLGGIRDMKKIPNLLIVVDPEREDTAVREANILNIPVLALADTNCNPDVIDYILPGNDDAMRAIRLIVSALADAVLEGKMLRGKASEEDDVDFEEFDAYEEQDAYDDEDLLGKSTLAKLRDSNLFEDDDEDDDDETSDEDDSDESVEEEGE